MFRNSVLALVVCHFVFGAARANPLTLQDKTDDLIQFATFIKDNYAPIEQKRILYGADVNQLLKKYLSYLPQSRTDEDYFYLIERFAAEFHDGHLLIMAPVYKSATLGFTTDVIEGKILIDKVDRSILSKKDFPFDHGDELITFNGRSATEELKSLVGYRGRQNPKNEIRNAAHSLSNRFGTLVPLPIEKEAILGMRHKARVFQNISIRWTVGAIDPNRPRGDSNCSGMSKIHVPRSATMVESSPFIAYYHPTLKGNVGYLRIGHFEPNFLEKIDASAWLQKYKKALQILQENTVALTIDESGNCGGDENLVTEIVQMFLERPEKNPIMVRFRAAPITLEMQKKALNEEIEKNPASPLIPGMENLVTALQESLQAGALLTQPVPDGSLSTFQPASVYTKPVMILIDELAGSCGDLFPAIMQDLGRAKLIGSTTAGAGGGDIDWENYELTHSHLKMDIMNRLINYRASGQPLEDLGAQPDYPYSPTVRDFLSGYRDYQKFYVRKLLESTF